ncbi:hypothetical protein H6P81_017742 [Aristolochia fimbriata]|uniref:Chlororespiratory reduction 4 n=1 Tax=Aristolochia fimbriata TaxID=158543 RepID=A0AAV7E3B4_ARIFI|nr:hypothetical protein H6P81_017742 [Aristolochia fimbriata]
MPSRSAVAGKLALLHHPNISQSFNAFSNISEFKQAQAYLITSGRLRNAFTAARLLAFAALSHSADCNYASLLFAQIPRPTFFMYNTMIRGLSQSLQPLESVTFYVRMLRSGVWPDKFTFPFLIRSCSVSYRLELGRQFHCHVVKYGLESNIYVVNNSISMYSNCGEVGSAQQLFDECSEMVDVVSWTALVTGYLNCGKLETARWFFDRMSCKNDVSWNAMIGGYARAGDVVRARELFNNMPDRNEVTWSAMISGCSQSGLCREALHLFKEMVAGGIVPIESTLVSAVSACAQLRVLEEGELVHACIKQWNFEVNVTLGTALVDMYGKCGNIHGALHVFKKMPEKNLLTWNSMITGLALNGYGKEVLMLFWRMLMLGLSPNAITFIGLLNACSHCGLVYEGHKLFDLMTRVYGIKPEAEHYGCMVDLLGRAGMIKEAVKFVEGMAAAPHPGLLGALAGACRIHGEIELGEEFGKQLVRLEPQHSGRYAVLYNSYAATERWNDAAMVRKMLKQRRVVKDPGLSIIGD